MTHDNGNIMSYHPFYFSIRISDNNGDALRKLLGSHIAKSLY